MTKARDLANLISTGAPLADGTIAVAEVTGAAPLASPTFTGTPSAPTATTSANTTQIATTAFVKADIANLVDSSPDALNTLNELAAALGDDANFSTTVTNNIATKSPLASPTFTGTATVPTLNATTAIQAGGTNVITSSRQLANIASVDATTVAALTAAGVGGGGGIELTTSEAVVEGDALAFNFTTGKVDKVTRVGGNSYDNVYDGNSGNLQLYDVIHIPEINKIAVLGQRSDGKRVIRLGTFNGGGWTWGTAINDNTTGDTGGAKLVWAANVSRLVSLVKDTGGSGPLKYRMYSVSGTTLSNVASGTVTTSNIMMAESATQIAAVYSPTHQRIIVAFPKYSPDCYRMVAGGASASGISWGNETSDIIGGGAGVENFGLTVNGSQIVYGFWSQYDTRYFVGAATLSGSTFTLGSFTNLGSSYTYDHQARGYMFHVSHISTANTYAYGIQNSGQDGFFQHFTVSGTTITLGNAYQTYNQSSSTTYGYNYAYDPTNDRLFSVRTNNKTANSGTNPDYIRDNQNNDAVNVHGGDSGFVRSAIYDADGGVMTFIGAQNPSNIYYYAPQVDNFYYFLGCAKEAASANTTVKINSAGTIATGLSGLTVGRTYRINYDGTFSNYGNAITQPTAFVNSTQRDMINGVALTTSTMLITNSFISY